MSIYNKHFFHYWNLRAPTVWPVSGWCPCILSTGPNSSSYVHISTRVPIPTLWKIPVPTCSWLRILIVCLNTSPIVSWCPAPNDSTIWFVLSGGSYTPVLIRFSTLIFIDDLPGTIFPICSSVNVTSAVDFCWCIRDISATCSVIYNIELNNYKLVLFD